MDSLGCYGLVYPMRSHIHAWNMAQGRLAEGNVWFNQSMIGWYVEVPNLVGFCICLIRAKFLFLLMSKCTCYYVSLMVVL